MFCPFVFRMILTWIYFGGRKMGFIYIKQLALNN